MSKRRIFSFIGIFSLLNLLFVPLLSLYGLRVCPVLSIPGFGFGCYYTALYIGLLLLCNITLLLGFAFGNQQSGVIAFLSRHLLLTTAGIYLFATASALLALHFLLQFSHLSTSSRAPEILGLASLLLGVTQGYGSMWAFRGANQWRASERAQSFQKNWIAHVFRTMFPVLVAAAVILHFLIGQSLSFNDGRTAPLADHDDMILQTSYLIYFLVVWLSVTFGFHFLSERDQVESVQLHLEKLGTSLDTKFRSETAGTWGLWRSILTHLNLFSQALGERSRLLSAFSKFVSAGVAKDVLSADRLNTSGITQEMTVIMIDIRGFTAISESLTPDQVVDLLNEYFSAMLTVIAELPVTVDKFIGDGILAYVDNQQSKENENRIAVQAALRMQVAISPLNDKLALKRLPAIKIGVGIYRGPLVIGLIGTEAKMQHTIIGDTVNRVARLESLTKELGVGIVISGWVHFSLDEPTKAKFRSFGKKEVKGIHEPMDVFGGPIESA